MKPKLKPITITKLKTTQTLNDRRKQECDISMSLDRWKADIEYELKQVNKSLEAANAALEELKTKKEIVDEVCIEVATSRQQDNVGYIFELQENLQKKINDKTIELIKLEENPKKRQLELLIEKIAKRIAEKPQKAPQLR